MKVGLGDLQEPYRVVLALTVNNDNATLGLDDLTVSQKCKQGNVHYCIYTMITQSPYNLSCRLNVKT